MLTMVVISLILVLSICCNLFLIWFSWKSLRQISEYDEELRELIEIIKNFSTHSDRDWETDYNI